jgi:uncharacterized protein YgiM (DUF1202 family)
MGAKSLLPPVIRRGLLAALICLSSAAPALAQENVVYVGRLPLNLRAGPGPAYSKIAELQPGEALAVLGQSGRWLNVRRVLTGEVGWVNGAYVSGPVALPPPASAGPGAPLAPDQVAVGTLPLNLRVGPGPAYPKLAELQPGEVLGVIGNIGKWINVTRLATGETGWVHGDYVTGSVIVPPVASPASPATPASASPTSALNAVVSDGPLNFREGPSKSQRALFRLPAGQYLTILSDDGAWASVQLPSGLRGWVMIRYLARLPAPPTTGNCRDGDVLKDVHHPQRLSVFNPCVTARGTVTEITRNPDGDLTFRLALDPEDAHLLNDGNRSRLRGDLQIEIVPADQPLTAEPQLGAHVAVTGAYVLDTEYGWMEIHPAWFVGP